MDRTPTDDEVNGIMSNISSSPSAKRYEIR